MQTKRWASSLFKIKQENQTQLNTIHATNTGMRAKNIKAIVISKCIRVLHNQVAVWHLKEQQLERPLSSSDGFTT